MKARPIADLRPEGPTGPQVAAVLGTRLAEVMALAPEALRPGAVMALHDLRIAGKRLRYGMEALAFCLAPGWTEWTERLEELQDRLGEIHDLDIGIALLKRHLDEALRRLRRRAKRLAGGPIDSAEVDALAHAMRVGAALGLLQLIRLMHERRMARHVEFVLFWQDLTTSGFEAEVAALWRGRE